MIFSFTFFSFILNGSSWPVTMFFQVLMQQSKRSCQDVHKEDRGNYHTRYPSDSDTTTKEVFGMFLF